MAVPGLSSTCGCLSEDDNQMINSLRLSPDCRTPSRTGPLSAAPCRTGCPEGSHGDRKHSAALPLSLQWRGVLVIGQNEPFQKTCQQWLKWLSPPERGGPLSPKRCLTKGTRSCSGRPRGRFTGCFVAEAHWGSILPPPCASITLLHCPPYRMTGQM